MKYIIYKITNLVNGYIYIGQHGTNNINDDYMGSGRALKRAFKEFGKHNFKKDILYVFNTRLEADLKEKELVTKEFINRCDTYNRYIGGVGNINTVQHTKQSLEAQHKAFQKIKHQQGSKNSHYNTVWVYNKETLHNRCIPKSELENYIKDGWVKGRIFTKGPNCSLQSRKVRRISDNKIYNSVTECARDNNLDPETIRNYCYYENKNQLFKFI